MPECDADVMPVCTPVCGAEVMPVCTPVCDADVMPVCDAEVMPVCTPVCDADVMPGHTPGDWGTALGWLPHEHSPPPLRQGLLLARSEPQSSQRSNLSCPTSLDLQSAAQYKYIFKYTFSHTVICFLVSSDTVSIYNPDWSGCHPPPA